MKMLVTKNQDLEVLEYPELSVKAGYVLVETKYSAISPGTEMTIKSRDNKEPVAIGYSASGIVVAVGEGVEGFREGQRVACYGGPYVRHAERLLVPKHLVTAVPEHVDLREAAFVGLGAIGIHALRQGNLQFGEHAVLIGLGILGQITTQVAHAAAYQVTGCDLLESRGKLLSQFGISSACTTMEQLLEVVMEQTQGRGTDAVFVCAGGKKSGLMDHSLKLIRDRGKIVIVGDILPDFTRALMFQKEAQIMISRAGGPGRYDADYEDRGTDYPIGFVRWTEGRNMQEYIRLLAAGLIKVAPLITHEAKLDHAKELFDSIAEHPNDTLGALIRYE
ncbi:MAG: alcohol dehydrogenase [Paenibacillus sp.]|jgi:threonine dehydrogenase-like Zn-dependent dehydrogenase|nr:alcohol dehydrogenase [Paenibacillus sp.]